MPANNVERPYEGLDFRLSAVRYETEHLSNLAEAFIQPESLYLINAWSKDLQSFAETREGYQWSWQVSKDKPIKTNLTKEYEQAGREGGRAVWGTLSFVWELTLIKRRPHAEFCLARNASCSMQIREQIGGEEESILVQWQFEVGAKDSPGCHFHVGLCMDRTEPPSPSWLPVPRLPGTLFLPTDALDFLLGELFQDSWQRTVSRDTNASFGWGNSQMDRLEKLLNWQLQQIREGSGSAWNRLKHRRPHRRLFVNA